MFKVHVGYTITGHNKWMHFTTLPEASAYVAGVFTSTGVVLGIEAVR